MQPEIALSFFFLLISTLPPFLLERGKQYISGSQTPRRCGTLSTMYYSEIQHFQQKKKKKPPDFLPEICGVLVFKHQIPPNFTKFQAKLGGKSENTKKKHKTKTKKKTVKQQKKKKAKNKNKKCQQRRFVCDKHFFSPPFSPLSKVHPPSGVLSVQKSHQSLAEICGAFLI